MARWPDNRLPEPVRQIILVRELSLDNRFGERLTFLNDGVWSMPRRRASHVNKKSCVCFFESGLPNRKRLYVLHPAAYFPARESRLLQVSRPANKESERSVSTLFAPVVSPFSETLNYCGIHSNGTKAHPVHLHHHPRSSESCLKLLKAWY